jgi:hypothetical protein
MPGNISRKRWLGEVESGFASTAEAIPVRRSNILDREAISRASS